MNLSVNIAGVEWKNPVTTASGTFGSGMEYAEYVDLNKLGAVTTKGGAQKFSGSTAENFRVDTDRLYLENMKRVRDDVAWFINKFDHKYADEPWKNAKDSLTRAMTKDNSIL